MYKVYVTKRGSKYIIDTDKRTIQGGIFGNNEHICDSVNFQKNKDGIYLVIKYYDNNKPMVAFTSPLINAPESDLNKFINISQLNFNEKAAFINKLKENNVLFTQANENLILFTDIDMYTVMNAYEETKKEFRKDMSNSISYNNSVVSPVVANRANMNFVR